MKLFQELSKFGFGAISSIVTNFWLVSCYLKVRNTQLL